MCPFYAIAGRHLHALCEREGGEGEEPREEGKREEAPTSPIVRSTLLPLRCSRPARAMDSHWRRLWRKEVKKTVKTVDLLWPWEKKMKVLRTESEPRLFKTRVNKFFGSD
jgi:hypothetical protein